MASRVHINEEELLDIYSLIDLGVSWSGILRKYKLNSFSRSATLNYIKMRHELHKARHEPASYMAKFLPEGYDQGMLGHSDRRKADVALSVELTRSETTQVKDLIRGLTCVVFDGFGEIPKDYVFRGYYPVGYWVASPPTYSGSLTKIERRAKNEF